MRVEVPDLDCPAPNPSFVLRVAHWFDDRRWHRVASLLWRVR